MNEVFSFSRFRRLFVKHTMEHYRVYLMSTAVLTGVVVLGGTFIFYLSDYPPEVGFQMAMFMILLFLAGTIFTSTVFSDFGDRSKAIPALTLPATALEKFLVAWIYSYPVFLIIYVAVFYLWLVVLGNIRHWSVPDHFYLLDIRDQGFSFVLVLYSMMHALTLYGAIFFRRLHFIKTGFAFFIGLGVITVINTLILEVLTGLTNVKLAVPFGWLNFIKDKHTYWVSAGGMDSDAVMVVLVIAAVMLWVAAYFRLKEKQV
jgi:hypothetical protein